MDEIYGWTDCVQHLMQPPKECHIIMCMEQLALGRRTVCDFGCHARTEICICGKVL